MFDLPDYDPTLVSAENVERVRSQVFIAELPGVTRELEQFFVGQVLTIRAESHRGSMPFWVAWAVLDTIVGPTIKAMLADSYKEETWVAIKLASCR